MRKKCVVYDVLNAGPRNRYTVLTSQGPLIAHNCGYGMGWEKFKATVKKETGRVITDELAKKAVNGYRTKCRVVRELWYQTDKAAKNAIRYPGEAFSVATGKVRYGMSKDRRFLMCQLPSGRFLRYYKPSVQTYDHPDWGEREEVRYWGIDSKTHQFKKLRTYGGSLVENYTQGIARDIMANGMLNADAAGFKLIFTVHDELVAEIEKLPPGGSGEKSELEVFIGLMCNTPEWAEGCPITAEGWTGERYRK